MGLAPLLDSHTVTNRLSEHYDWYQQNKLNKRQARTGCYSIFFLLCITVDLTPLPPNDWLMYFLPQGSPHVNQYLNYLSIKCISFTWSGCGEGWGNDGHFGLLLFTPYLWLEWGAFHLLSWVKGGANLPQSIFYNNQVLHIFPIYCLSNAEFSSSLLQHVKQFSTITKSYIPACSNISKLIINNDQTDLNSKYICVVDEELRY